MTEDDAIKAFKAYPKSDRHIAEAEFGRTYIEPELARLKPGARVLEVGSGAGILLHQLATENPAIEFIGLEPSGHGFSYEHVYHSLVNNLPNAELLSCGYEDLQVEGGFDLIYLVNVFEHLPDWSDFMVRLQSLLNPDGQCLILCPNYSFPYEPHFSLPIVFNKRLSHALLKNKIAEFERQDDCAGLWRSLNFVKFGQVKKRARQLDLSVTFRKTIIEDMISRLDSDPEFRSRQAKLVWPVRLAQRTGLVHLLTKTRLFERWLPYMFLAVSRRDFAEGQHA